MFIQYVYALSIFRDFPAFEISPCEVMDDSGVCIVHVVACGASRYKMSLSGHARDVICLLYN